MLTPNSNAICFLVFRNLSRFCFIFAHVSFGEQLRMLPPSFRKFLVAVGLFGAGDFAHTLLILLATQKLTPELGATKAASIAVGLYVLHNVFYAGFAFIAGWLADRFPKNLVLASGYALAAVMASAIIFLPLTVWTLAAIFILGGVMWRLRKHWRIRSAPNSWVKNITAWRLAHWRR